ncbi:hypothetical protein KJ815_00005, partial [bacterium]|nr:hypothetical protein [bacterium]
MTRFLIALCGFAGGIVSALILASIFTAGNGELVEPKTTVAQSQEGVTAVNRQAKQSPDNSEERRQSAASEAPEVPDSEPFAPVLKSLSPGSPLRDFALRFRKAGLWDKMPIC